MSEEKLKEAIRKGDMVSLETELKEMKTRPDAHPLLANALRFAIGTTYTVTTESVDCVQRLLRAGADVNLPDELGTTALMDAIMNETNDCCTGYVHMTYPEQCDTRLIETLLSSGAQVNRVTFDLMVFDQKNGQKSRDYQ